MPDTWERRCKLVVGVNDARADKDRDGLLNIDELDRGTSPCNDDTDRGGERDGSEVAAGRNPLWADDDKAYKVLGITILPLNAAVNVNWSQRPNTHIKVYLCLSLTAGALGNCRDIGDDGSFTLTGLANGVTHYITLYGEGAEGAQGTYSDQLPVTPTEDPIPPQGAFFIDGPTVIEGGDVAMSRSVILFVDAIDTDSEYDGPAGAGSHSIPHGLVSDEHTGMFTVSGNVEMRFANTSQGIESAPWQPLADTLPWQLGCADGTICTVFGQFRDGAGNESLVVDQKILLKLEPLEIFLPTVRRN